MSRATPSTCCRSAEPSSPVGVPTAMKMICDCRTPLASAVVNVSRFSALVAPDHLLQAGLVDRDLPSLEHPDFRRILVDANDLVTVFGEARAGHEANVASSNNRYLHSPALPTRYKALTLAQPKITVNLLTQKDLASLLSIVHTVRPRAVLAWPRVRILLDYRPALRAAHRRRGVRPPDCQRPLRNDSQARRHPDTLLQFLERPPVAGCHSRGRVVDARVPVTFLNLVWHRLEWPPVELFAGEVDVAHSMHPLLMPARRAAQVVTDARSVFSGPAGEDARRRSAATTRRSPRRMRSGPTLSSPFRSTRPATSGQSSASLARSHHDLSTGGAGVAAGRRRDPARPHPLHGHHRAAQERAGPASRVCRPRSPVVPDAPPLALAGQHRADACQRVVDELPRRPSPGACAPVGYVSGTDRERSIARRRCSSCPRSTKASASRRSKP